VILLNARLPNGIVSSFQYLLKIEVKYYSLVDYSWE